VLDECLRESSRDREIAFARFQERRKVNADAIADLALANFVEMRDHVASSGFLFRKKLEKVLHRLFPERFVPLYTMVSFTRTPYSVAVARAARQDQMLKLAGGLILLVALAFLMSLLF
jgi:kynurenine 3-monooxygenase